MFHYEQGRVRFETKILNAQCDPWDRLHWQQIFAIGQEVADLHAAHDGMSGKDLAPRGFCWMISGIQAQTFGPLPSWGDRLIIESACTQVQGIRFRREYHFYRDKVDAAHLVAKAVSDWFLVDVASRRPAKPLEVFGQERIDEHLSPSTIPIRRLDKIAPIEKGRLLFESRVRFSDLDRNQHMNNTRYVSLAMDALYSFLQGAPQKLVVDAISIRFMAECLHQDPLQVYGEARESEDGRCFAMRLERQEHDEAFRAEIRYRLPERL